MALPAYITAKGQNYTWVDSVEDAVYDPRTPASIAGSISHDVQVRMDTPEGSQGDYSGGNQFATVDTNQTCEFWIADSDSTKPLNSGMIIVGGVNWIITGVDYSRLSDYKLTLRQAR